jgi:RNA polymerase sigma factor (sigma-70 family)
MATLAGGGPAAGSPDVLRLGLAHPIGLAVSAPTRDFDDFYRAHRDEIGRALVFTLGDQSLGQEAVDEAMAKAYQKWAEVGAGENPAGWVFVVGKRWGLSWLRGRRRERRREELVGDAESQPAPAQADLVDLMDALAQLNLKHRTVIVCRFSLGMSVKDTAAVLGIGEGTVKSRSARALEQLRTLTEVAT